MTRCQSCKTRHGCFGYPGEPPVSCAAHKAEGMVDVVHPRCRSVGCSKRPSFGPPGAKPLACAAHRSPGWIDLKNKRAYHRRCQADGCELIPVFGSPDEAGSKGALRCRKHRLPGHVDVIHPQCEQEAGCTLRPSFAFWPSVSEGSGGKKKPLRCREHKLAGMVDTKNRRCDEPSCSKKRLVGSRTCHSHTSPLLLETSGGISCSGKVSMKRNRSTTITEKPVGQTGFDTKEVHMGRGTAVQDPSTSRWPSQSGEGSHFTFPTSWAEVLIGNASGGSGSGIPLSSSSHSCSPSSPSLAGAPGSTIPTNHSIDAGESRIPAGDNVKFAVAPIQGMMMHDQSGSDPMEADGSGLSASSPSSSLSLARRKALTSREEKLEPSSDGMNNPQMMLMLGLGPSPPAYLEVSSASPRSCEMEQVASACTDDVPNGHCFQDDRAFECLDLQGVTSQTNNMSGGSQVPGDGGVDGKVRAGADTYVGDTTESLSLIAEGPSRLSLADDNLLGFEISSGHTLMLASRQTAHSGM